MAALSGSAGLGLGVAAIGLLSGAGGAYLSGQAAGQKRGELRDSISSWLPNSGVNQQEYFSDLSRYFAPSQKLSNQMADAEQTQALKLRESAMPGLNENINRVAPNIYSLMRGEVPDSVMHNFQRAGGASSVGGGFGGSGYGFLNTGLYGARGSMGAMDQGWSLLSSLMSTLPKVSAPSAASFLTRGIYTPEQTTQNELTVRQQNLAVESQLASMKTSGDVWGGFLSGLGGTLTGAGLGMMGGGGMGGMMGGGGGMGGGGSPYGNPTPNYMGSAGGSAYYDVPVTYNPYIGTGE